MTRQKNGHILNMGSVAGIQASADRSLYCTTKAAVHLLTKCLALELGPLKIQVNCLAPGLVDSGRVKVRLAANPEYAEKRISQIPVRRLGDPENIASTALFIVSPENKFMNGAIVSINGGVSAGRARTDTERPSGRFGFFCFLACSLARGPVFPLQGPMQKQSRAIGRGRPKPTALSASPSPAMLPGYFRLNPSPA